MSVNYYWRNRSAMEALQEQESRVRSELRSLSKNTSIELDDIIDKYFERETLKAQELVHIGVDSFNWQFLFADNDFELYNDKESLIKWLKSGEITDEYGKIHSFEEFWDLVVKSNTGYDRAGDKYTRIDGLIFSNYL